jgi:hypothetical protein
MRERTRRLLAPVLGAAVAAGALVATTSPAVAAVPGHQLLSVGSATDSTNFKSVTATCPSGTVLIGTGHRITGGTGEVVVDDLRPNGSATTAPTAVTVGAYETDGFAGDWTLHAEAVCANVAGAIRVSVTGPSNSDDAHTTRVNCPANKRLTGTGYEMNVAVGDAAVDILAFSIGSATAPAEVLVRALEADPIAGNWNLTAYGICTNPLPGLEMVLSSGAAADSAAIKTTTAFCPSGKVTTGGGFVIVGGDGEVVLDDLNPTIGTVKLMAAEEDAFAGNWSLSSYGICATA